MNRPPSSGSPYQRKPKAKPKMTEATIANQFVFLSIIDVILVKKKGLNLATKLQNVFKIFYNLFTKNVRYFFLMGFLVLNVHFTNSEWAHYLHFHAKPKGWLAERWVHFACCGRWFNLWRNTITHEIGLVNILSIFAK